MELHLKIWLFYEKQISIVDGVIVIDTSGNKSDSNSTDISNETNKGNSTEEDGLDDYDIVIINSLKINITQGKRIIFDINPIERKYYNLPNNEIIFESPGSRNVLYLKNCAEIEFKNYIYQIECSVSNNMMKGNYTKLSDGQKISILNGKEINLYSDISIGGFFEGKMNMDIDVNKLSEQERKNFKLTFNINYYNPSVGFGEQFPYSVSLEGKKKSLRNLEDLENSYTINFPQCTRERASNFEEMSSIACETPNFIPAGNYNKLKSQGIDQSPYSNIGINFENDFYKDSSTPINKIEKSSSSSKTWVIWLVAGILLAVLLGIVLIVCIVSRKKNGAGDESKNGNSSVSSNSQRNIEEKSGSDNSFQ